MKLLYLLLTVVLIIFLLPVYLLISLIIITTTGYPILYFQKRTGKGGEEFRLYKFRTMIVEAETKQIKLKKINEADGPVFKIYNDPRYTTIGKFLSHTGLDELPQVINILKGDMALIGPRPLPVDQARKLKVWQQKRHVIKPGIISPWILEGYHSRSFNEWMKSDIAYIAQKSLIYDLSIMLKAGWLFITLIIREVFQKKQLIYSAH